MLVDVQDAEDARDEKHSIPVSEVAISGWTRIMSCACEKEEMKGNEGKITEFERKQIHMSIHS